MRRTLHLVSHTHWDREWYQTYQQFRLRLVHLVDGVLDMLAKDREFKYFMLDGQTIVLDDYLAVRPEREAEIGKLVRQGRLVIGPWRILPDEFLVSPESTIRNLLRGEADCRRFGPKMEIGYIPDPFGHIGQMPQILRGFGIESACVQRGLDDQPCEFWWEAPDGSHVLMVYLRDGYGNAAGLPSGDPERFNAEVRRLRDSLDPHAHTAHFLLMHGTDHMEPPADTGQLIRAARGKLDGDVLIHSTLPAFVHEVRRGLRGKTLPALRGELRSSKRFHMLPGVLSARMWIKQRNVACETLLEQWAEPFSALADRAGIPLPSSIQNPHSALAIAWELLLQNHPHDSICGCSIDQVHDEMRPRFDQVEQIGEQITLQSLQALAAAVDTRAAPEDAFGAVVVFNPHGFPAGGLVSAEVVPPREAAGFEIVDESGTPLPYESLGLGGQDLINVRMTKEEIGALIGNLHEGRAGNLALQDYRSRREGGEVRIEALMIENGIPDREAWLRASDEMKAVLDDQTVTHFHIRARAGAGARVTFPAAEVPGLGRRTYYLRPKEASAPAQLPGAARMLMPLATRLAGTRFGGWLIARLQSTGTQGAPRLRGARVIENEFLRVEARRDGSLRMTDKRDGTVFAGLNRFVDGADCGDEYNYSPTESDRLYTAKLRRVKVNRGAVSQSLTLELDLRIPESLSADRKARSRKKVRIPVTTTLTLTPGVARADVRTRVDNRARDHRLRVHFPAPLKAETAWHDGHFEVVERPVGLAEFDPAWAEDPRPEVPQRAFTSVTNGKLGLTVAVRGLPEVEALPTGDGTEIAVTLLRCVGWLSRDDFTTRRNHAGPFLETPGAQMPGAWDFDYAIIPGADGDARRLAYAFQSDLRAVPTGLHAGRLAPAGSFVHVEGKDFLVSALKRSEDGRGWLLRGVNLDRKETRVTLQPWRRHARVERIDMAERRHAALKPNANGVVQFHIRGHEVVSVLFRDK